MAEGMNVELGIAVIWWLVIRWLLLQALSMVIVVLCLPCSWWKLIGWELLWVVVLGLCSWRLR